MVYLVVKIGKTYYCGARGVVGKQVDFRGWQIFLLSVTVLRSSSCAQATEETILDLALLRSFSIFGFVGRNPKYFV